MSVRVQGPIRLAHIITRVGYFILLLAWAILLLIFLAQVFFGLPETWKFTFDLPLTLDLGQTGVLSTGAAEYPVKINAVRGQVIMEDPPSIFIWLPSLVTLVYLALITLAVWYFKGFMNHMVAKEFFHKQASQRLRQTAGWLTLAWFIKTTTTFWASVWVQNHVAFNDVNIDSTFPWDLSWLAIALFLWMVSRILDHGRHLEEEQKLTI